MQTNPQQKPSIVQPRIEKSNDHGITTDWGCGAASHWLGGPEGFVAAFGSATPCAPATRRRIKDFPRLSTTSSTNLTRDLTEMMGIVNFSSTHRTSKFCCSTNAARHTCSASDFSHVMRSLQHTEICMREGGPLVKLP